MEQKLKCEEGKTFRRRWGGNKQWQIVAKASNTKPLHITLNKDGKPIVVHKKKDRDNAYVLSPGELVGNMLGIQ